MRESGPSTPAGAVSVRSHAGSTRTACPRRREAGSGGRRRCDPFSPVQGQPNPRVMLVRATLLLDVRTVAQTGGVTPPQLLQADPVVPDLRQVTDPLAVKVHARWPPWPGTRSSP